MEPLQRVTENLIVLNRGFDCYLWNISKGSARPLWPGPDETLFLKLEDRQVYFLWRLKPRGSLLGVKLTTAASGRTIVSDWFRARDKLCRLTPEDQEAQELGLPALEHIIEVTPEGLWAVTADEPRYLCFISNDAKMTSVIPFDPAWIAVETQTAFSPQRGYIALAVLRKDQDFFHQRDLIVVDVKHRSIVHTASDVELPYNALLSTSPQMKMGWTDETHLLFGLPEQEQELDAINGNVFASFATKLAPPAPSPPEGRKRVGLFECTGGDLWFAGDKDQAGSVRDERQVMVGDIEISTDGKWASFLSAPPDRQVYLLDGVARTKHKILLGWAYGIKWLPGTKE